MASVFRELREKQHEGLSTYDRETATAFRENREKQYGGMSHYDRDLSLNYLRNQSSMNREASESSDEEPQPGRKKKSKRKRKQSLIANLSLTRYDIIRVAAEKYGFTVSKDDDLQNCFLIWSDSFVSNERVTELKSFQRINHFPGMGEICRKDFLARNMAKMSKVHPDEFNFVPRTWLMPQEHSQFQSYLKELRKNNKKKTFIIKPANGSMGNGIRLMQSTDAVPQLDNAILQEYIDKPFLVDGYKCDMRIYVLVTCCDPLRVFLYDEGLLRLSTQPYIHPNDSNLASSLGESSKTKKDTLYMHLTNYSVNKRSSNYLKSENDSTGSKRSLRFLNEHLRNHYDIKTLWRNIIDLIIKTMIVVEPHLLHAYRMCRPGQNPGSDSVCFEILGFDILLDRKLRPWLLEVNRSPSFGTDEKIDKDTKSMLLLDTFKLVNIKLSDKRRDLAEQKALTQRRLLQNLQPKPDYFGDLDRMKKQKSIVKKKELLLDMLARHRREASRDEFERHNGGRYRRIFPPDDRLRSQKFAKLLLSAFSTFSNSNQMIQKEIEATYEKRLGEHEILEMLAEFEQEEKAMKMPKGHPDQEGADRAARSAPASSSRASLLTRGSEQNSPGPATSAKSAGRAATSARHRIRSRASMQGTVEVVPASPLDPAVDEPAAKTLRMLKELSIKFPGKTEDEAEELLEDIYDKWPHHKAEVAKYWLVKLDSAKRVKVLNIVRTNVKCILQRAYCSSEVDNLRLSRLFTRIFNRLLWSNGQGLWECFNTQGSWETMLCKSTESITPAELSCCRRIVDLCKNCLLTVYQYATESAMKQPPVLLTDKDLDANITISPHRQRT